MCSLLLHNEAVQRDVCQHEGTRAQRVVELPGGDELVVLIADIQLREPVMGEVKEVAAEVRVQGWVVERPQLYLRLCSSFSKRLRNI